ncbi:glucosamine-6-phosphate deaminase [Aerococcaceae bacterium DSM 111022]|nr:glucosamine-6-phosphate deaminase [Aerococcaceae bacterium DSM 111022]
MEVKIVDSQEEAAQIALDIFRETLDDGGRVFGFATGSTPEKTYEALVKSDLDFSEAIGVNLDEYFGLPSSHPQSYAQFMKEHLYSKKEFQNAFIPNGMNKDVASEIEKYDRILERNPRDLQLLGIGVNAHIGFNEPGTKFDTTTQLVELTDETINANKRFFESVEDVPTEAYSMGIKSIYDAKRIILMAFGENKASAIKAMIDGPVMEDVPASILQRHPNVTVILDQEAASEWQQPAEGAS